VNRLTHFRLNHPLHLVILVAWFLAGCAPIPVTEPETVVEETGTGPADAAEPVPDTIAHPLGDPEQTTATYDPHELIAQSENASAAFVPWLLMQAASLFIEQDQAVAAQSTLDRLETYPLTTDERIDWKILRARAASALGQHTRAISLLDPISPDDVRDIGSRIQMLSILANAQAQAGQHFDSVQNMLHLDKLAAGKEKEKNQHDLVSLLSTMGPLSLSILREGSTEPALDGWMALVEILQTTPPGVRPPDLDKWHRFYPGHPALPDLFNQPIESIDLTRYRQIALLLPLTSSYGAAAQAFYDGFMDAHQDHAGPGQPRIILYDIGDEPSLSSFYYQAAANDGADFIAGPLGRTAVEALLSDRAVEVNTFVIAEIPEDRSDENLFGISLSPEAEAQQIAEKVFAEGFTNASVLRSETDWGQRVANAFVFHWEALGGVMVRNSYFPKDVHDYTTVLQKFLGLDHSIARHRLLQAQVKTKLKFTARRDDNVDFLFLAANAEQARLVVPQLRFFQAHDLPVYATSYVYTGVPNPRADADLDGLIFSDMKWILDGVNAYKREIEEERARKEAEQAAKALEDRESPETIPEDGENTENGKDPNGTGPEIADGPGIVDEEEGTPGENPVSAEEGSLPVVGQDPALVSAEEGSLPVTEEEADSTVRSLYENTPLGRLYALGFDTYNLIPRAVSMRGNGTRRYVGEAMTMGISDHGSVRRHPFWFKFSAGLAEPLETSSERTVFPPRLPDPVTPLP